MSETEKITDQAPLNPIALERAVEAFFEAPGGNFGGVEAVIRTYLNVTQPVLPGSVLDDIAAERARQIEKEGWTPEHDDQHEDQSMAQAAACYAYPRFWHELLHRHMGGRWADIVPWLWPTGWAKTWWKPKDRRSDLIRAAALIVAEIERLDRAAARNMLGDAP